MKVFYFSTNLVYSWPIVAFVWNSAGKLKYCCIPCSVRFTFPLLLILNSHKEKASKLCKVVYAFCSRILRYVEVSTGASQNQKATEDIAGVSEAA